MINKIILWPRVKTLCSKSAGQTNLRLQAKATPFALLNLLNSKFSEQKP